MEMAQLRAELDSVQQSLGDERQKGAEANSERVAELEAQQAELLRQITALEQMEQHEGRIQASVQETQNWIETATIAGLPIESYFPDPNEFGLLKIVFKQRDAEIAARNSKQVMDVQNECNERLRLATDENKQLQEQIAALQADVTKSDEEKHELSAQISILTGQVEDLESKRKAAMTELEEARGIIDQKNGHIDQLHQQIALGAVGMLNVVDVEEEAKKAEMERQTQLRRVVYDLVPDNVINPKNYTAKRALNDEEITINWAYLKNFKVLESQEEARRFREENSTVDQGGDEAVLPDMAAPELNVPSFPSQEEAGYSEDDGLSVGGHSTTPEMVGPDTVSREEFTALERRVDQIYRVANISEVA